MTDDEMMFQLGALLSDVLEAQTAQTTGCAHRHHCHRVPQLFRVEETARDLIHEFDIRQGERLIAAAAKRKSEAA